MTFVIIASTPWNGHRLYEHRLGPALAVHHRVLYVEPPAHRFRRRPVDVPDHNFEVLRPVTVPFGRRRPLAGLTAVCSALAVRVALRRQRASGVVLVVTSMHPWAVKALRGYPLLALVKDDYVAASALLGINPRRVAEERSTLNARADRVVAVSPVLQRALRVGAGAAAAAAVSLVPAGCTVAPALPEPEELRDLPHPRAVFSGQISSRVDFRFFEVVAENGVHLVTVGSSRQDSEGDRVMSGLEARGMLTRLASRSAAEVDAVVQHCDVGLVPYHLDAFNNASFPLKTLEYLAAGIPVLGSDLPSLRWLGSEEVFTASPSDISGALDRALLLASSEGSAEACRRCARQHSWTSRAEDFARLGHEILDERRGR